MSTVHTVPLSPSSLLTRARRYHVTGDFLSAACVLRQAIELRLRLLWESGTDRLWRKKCPLGRLVDECVRRDLLTGAEQEQLSSILTPLNQAIHGHDSFGGEQAARIISSTRRFLAGVGRQTEGGEA